MGILNVSHWMSNCTNLYCTLCNRNAHRLCIAQNSLGQMNVGYNVQRGRSGIVKIRTTQALKHDRTNCIHSKCQAHEFHEVRTRI